MNLALLVGVGWLAFMFGFVMGWSFRPKPAPPKPGRHRKYELTFDDLLKDRHQW